MKTKTQILIAIVVIALIAAAVGLGQTEQFQGFFSLKEFTKTKDTPTKIESVITVKEEPTKTKVLDPFIATLFGDDDTTDEPTSCVPETYNWETGLIEGSSDICGEDEMCYKGECIDACIDLDGGDYYTQGWAIYEEEDNPILRISNESSTMESICDDGTLTWKPLDCPDDTIGGACIDKSEDFEHFLDWMHDKGYDEEIIDYYREKFNDPDEEYSEAIAEYFVLRDSIWDGDSFFSIYKNSKQGDVITLTIVEIYPTEPGWIYKRSAQQWADSRGQSLEEYLEEKAENLTTALGRQVVLEVEQIYISYEDWVFCDDCDYSLIDEPNTYYVSGDTFHPYPEDDTWAEYETNGYISSNIYFTNEQSLFLLYSDLTPKYPGATYVFMGGISPDDYYFGIPNIPTGCYGIFNSSYVVCEDVGTATTSYVHELGHVFGMPHATAYEDPNRPLGVPTVMGGDSADWPCYNTAYLTGGDYYYASYSPLERYTIEPYDGFENEDEFVQEYNEAVLCP